MALAAVCLWGLTALVGLVLFGTWLANGGVRRGSTRHGRHRRLPRTLVFGHALLAIVGLGVWIGFLALARSELTWAALGVIAVAAVLGLLMFARWVPSYRGRARFGTGPGAAHRAPTAHWTLPEHHFPLVVVVAHGVLAVATVALVVLTVLSVGE